MNLNAELTKRETEVAEFIAWGAAEKQIAYKLGVAVNTVKNTKRNIYEKVGVQSVGALSAWWFVVKHGVSLAAKPLLSILFIFLIGVNEFNDDDSQMIRTGRAKTVRVKVGKGRRRQEHEDNTIEFI